MVFADTKRGQGTLVNTKKALEDIERERRALAVTYRETGDNVRH